MQNAYLKPSPSATQNEIKKKISINIYIEYDCML